MTKNNKIYQETFQNSISATDIFKTAELLKKSLDASVETDEICADCTRSLESFITKVTTDKKCPHCGKFLLLSDLPQYDFVCPSCDENFYKCEV